MNEVDTVIIGVLGIVFTSVVIREIIRANENLLDIEACKVFKALLVFIITATFTTFISLLIKFSFLEKIWVFLFLAVALYTMYFMTLLALFLLWFREDRNNIGC